MRGRSFMKPMRRAEALLPIFRILGPSGSSGTLKNSNTATREEEGEGGGHSGFPAVAPGRASTEQEKKKKAVLWHWKQF